MVFKAVIFDMDGTLIDSLGLWGEFWKEFGKKYINDETFQPSDADEKAVRTMAMKDAMELIHRNYNFGKDGLELLDIVNRMMVDFYSNKVLLKVGTKEFLEHLYKEGTKMCIASATSPDLIKLALKRCGIEKYFEKIFSCSEIGKGKEEPDIFFVARDFLGEKTEDTWVIEDSYAALETAAKAGFKTVGVFEKYNLFGQEKIKEIANEYIAEGQSIDRLI